MNIKTLSFGCRLNALECDKIAGKLSGLIDSAILANTCSVTAEAERQCAQAIRKLSRENPNAVIFVTGCGATRNPGLFASIPRAFVIDNRDKMDLKAYENALRGAKFDISCSKIEVFKETKSKLSKRFIQVQNGCNHDCTYCVTRLLRGPSISFPYQEILADAQSGVKEGFSEIVLTGVDTASYVKLENDKPVFLSDICARLLQDVPEIQRLRLSSIDPASPEVPKIINLIKSSSRFMPHLHLSMQSGSDPILMAMRRRHTANSLRAIIKQADGKVSFSADIICGFPGETEDLFNETAQMVREMGLIHVHAFPFSPRPNTVAASMPNQINRATSKKRVKILDAIANENKRAFMEKQIDTTVSVLVEDNNIARTPDDLDVKILGPRIKNKTVCDVKITGIENNIMLANRI